MELNWLWTLLGVIWLICGLIACCLSMAKDPGNFNQKECENAHWCLFLLGPILLFILCCAKEEQKGEKSKKYVTKTDEIDM